MKKIFNNINSPQNMAMLGACLVALMPYLSDKFKIGALAIGICLLIEEFVRYIVLKKPFMHILIIFQSVIFCIPMLLILLVENYYHKYQMYVNYLYIWCGLAFFIFYLTLMTWVWRNRFEMRRFIIILHGIMLIGVSMVIIGVLLK
ncbi:hypothetical protein [Clostridium ganghwense]|uniref:Uncharacterized protein n=1 Tax=Clostridium ganghwense TaxID=312089 RepID=A0ABT4CNJ1_9CLOT|nr:hypothetical protein [Clostridium ganghwense]MCY6370626.1 hypothetical protein [Clostridium ganghwense]